MDKELGGVPDRRENERWMRITPTFRGKAKARASSYDPDYFTLYLV